MKDQPSRPKSFIREEITTSFEDWLNRPYISAALRGRLSQANLLILPTETFPRTEGPVFPVGTEGLFNFLRDNAPEGIVAEICIEDKDYKELALHSDLVIIGAFLVSAIVAPVAADLIAEYIKRRVWSNRRGNVDVRVELTVITETGRAIRLFYEGPATELRDTIVPALEASRLNPVSALPTAEHTKDLPDGANSS